jgi:hypothetical protein
VTLTLDGTVDEFDRAAFVQKMAASLGVDPSELVITDVRPGSIIVDVCSAPFPIADFPHAMFVSARSSSLIGSIQIEVRDSNTLAKIRGMDAAAKVMPGHTTSKPRFAASEQHESRPV